MHTEQLDDRQRSANLLIKRTNIVLLIGGILLLPLSFVILGVPLLLFFLLIVICSFTVAIQSRLCKLHAGKYAASILVGLIIVWGIALVGFYGPNTSLGNEFEIGRGTYVLDKNLGTALKSTLLQADTFSAAALFGYHCSDTNCSNSPWYKAILTDYVILTLGVVMGNALFVCARQHQLISK